MAAAVLGNHHTEDCSVECTNLGNVVEEKLELALVLVLVQLHVVGGHKTGKRQSQKVEMD